MNVKIYVEGGGDAQALRTRCRRGFSQFFERAGLGGRMPAIVACGSRSDTYTSFKTAAASAGDSDFPVLLVDSEEEVTEDQPWKHLKVRDDWQRPELAKNNQAHLMVQCMESWFLADRQCLAKYFGGGFTEKPLPDNRNIEEVAKAKVFTALKMSTRQSKTKGEYGKGKHSFEILGELDPEKVRAASKHADNLLTTLDEQCQR